MSLLDFFFPKHCVWCKKYGEYVCANCFTKFSFSVSPKCLVCNRASFNSLTHPRCKGKYVIDGCFSALNYKGILRKLIYQFKYQPYLTDLQHVLADLMYEQLIQDELFHPILQAKPVLVPIPLSSSKLRKRGYNQSEILAKNLGKKLGLEVKLLLKRTKETKPQYGLKREERVKNMQHAFSIKHSAYGKNATAFLVDDIVTTGSTLLEAAHVLKRNGFEKVYGVVLAQD